MLTRTQAETMLALQARMNSRVDPDWLRSAWPYLRAVVIETAEAIEHHGWKWWKKQEKDERQLQMELIDIWHFLLSELLLRYEGDEEKSGEALMRATAKADSAVAIDFDGRRYSLDELDLLAMLELLIGLSVARRIEIALFERSMHECGLSWDGLFSQYVSKNVLNFFRQDHGYQEGSYRKLWEDGREDNEHLVEIMAGLDPEDENYQQRLYDSLSERYQR